MEVHKTYCANHFTILESQVIMLYTVNIHSVYVNTIEGRGLKDDVIETLYLHIFLLGDKCQEGGYLCTHETITLNCTLGVCSGTSCERAMSPGLF